MRSKSTIVNQQPTIVNGTIIKSSNFAYNQTTGLYTTGSWVDKSAADNLNNQTTVTNITISTVYFPNRYQGFIGGSYNNTVQTTAWRSYARVLNDESGIFSTKFYYDKLGRIVVSQNSRQYNGATKKYSYTTYDALGRVSEAGEKSENSSGTAFQSVFGTMVSTYYNPQVIDDANLNSWITGSGARKEVTKTYYDYSNTAIAANLPGSFTPTHLRKRVAHVTYEETFDNNDATYDAASHYTYDIHGNVNTLLQENNNTGVTGQDIKRIDYTYDLISGNVHEVKYQSGFADGMIHKYRYDADNRITHVYTSTDGVHEDLDAKYFYYAHGPLARTELGNEKVQGVDYVYTLHGWIKGVNSNTLDSTRDVGRDGNTIANNPNAGFAPDVFGYTLNYYDTVGISDYRPIDATNRWNTVTTRFESDKTGSDALAARKNLWNGNIGMMVTAIQNPSTYATLPQAMSYEYDQLNRLKVAKGFVNLNMATNTWQNGSTYNDRYYNAFSYDANGNILTQVRHNEAGTRVENLSYKYERDANGRLLRNRLYHVNETVSAGAFTDDIDDQGVFTTANINVNNNYGYDEEGRLVRDDAEDIAQIKWTVTSKVKEVIRSNGSPKKNLKFDYDASGKRIAKHVYNSSNVWEKSSYYTYDATGNVMAVYEKVSTDPDDPSMITYHVIERHIYGSARIGMNTAKAELSAATALPDTGNYVHLIGKKQFELSNHLGNVLSSISDKLIAKDWNNDQTVDSYKAEILFSQDYTPFGVKMDGRTFSNSYRYGFNGKETDDETGIQDYGFRMYNVLLGRFLSVDPLAKEYTMISNYQYASNTPIWAIDLDGLEAVVYTYGSSGQAGDKNGDFHAMIAIQDPEEGLIVYTYGRYSNDDSPIAGGGILIKLTGHEARAEINHAMQKNDGKAYYIQKVNAGEVKSFYENKLAGGDPIDEKGNQYSKDSKTHKARRINTYSVLTGSICSGWTEKGLKAGGFKWRKELLKGEYSKSDKFLGFIKVQFSVQILEARLNATARNDRKLQREIKSLNAEIDVLNRQKSAILTKDNDADVSLIDKAIADKTAQISNKESQIVGVKDVTSQEKKSAGSSLKK